MPRKITHLAPTVCPFLYNRVAPRFPQWGKMLVTQSDLTKLITPFEAEGNAIYPCSALLSIYYHAIHPGYQSFRKTNYVPNLQAIIQKFGLDGYYNPSRREIIAQAIRTLLHTDTPLLDITATDGKVRYFLSKAGTNLARRMMIIAERTIGGETIMKTIGGGDCRCLVKAVTKTAD